MASLFGAFQMKRLPENYFRAAVSILRCFGIELERRETVAYGIFSKISIFFWAYFYTFVECYELYASWGDVNAMTHVVNYSVTHIIGAIKITVLFLTRGKLKRIMKRLHEGILKPNRNRGGDEEEKLVRECIHKTELVMLVFTGVVALVFFSGLLEAFQTIIRKPQQNWHLPFLSISIVDTTYSPMFQMAFLFQVVSVVVVGGAIIATDMLRCSIMAHLSCQFRILQNAFRNVKKRAEYSRNSSKGKYVSLEECFDEVLDESINHHLEILELAARMEELCSMMVLIIFLSGVLQLCFMLYQASVVPIGSSQFMQNTFYWCDIAIQVLIYCYFGDEVTAEAANVPKAVTEMDWTDASKSSRKAVILVIARSQKPLHMTAGGFVSLSLPTFMSIVKGSFSYFMVFRQVNDESSTN